MHEQRFFFSIIKNFFTGYELACTNATDASTNLPLFNYQRVASRGREAARRQYDKAVRESSKAE